LLTKAQQQLLQKDAQIITPEALASVKAAIAKTETEQRLEANKKAVPRRAAGQTWEDPTLANWPESKLLMSHLTIFLCILIDFI
jgi:hypothetical protein